MLSPPVLTVCVSLCAGVNDQVDCENNLTLRTLLGLLWTIIVYQYMNYLGVHTWVTIFYNWRSEGRAVIHLSLHLWVKKKTRCEFDVINNHCCWKLGVWISSRNEANIIPVANIKSLTEESMLKSLVKTWAALSWKLDQLSTEDTSGLLTTLIQASTCNNDVYISLFDPCK